MADEGFKRKLAAILSADVEGYSRLMDDDEEATVRTLTAYRTVISDLVQQYRGRVVDAPGAAAHRVVRAKEAVGRKWRIVAISVTASIIFSLGIAYFVWDIYFRLPTVNAVSAREKNFSLAQGPSIAVLPFENMSGDPEQDYFCDGLTENIITGLSSSPGLLVIARNSSFAYKGKPMKVSQIATELGVRYVVEGSVQKTDEGLRITAQLIDAKSGHHMWAEKYDRDLKDIFELQDELTLNIMAALNVRLTEGEQARFRLRRSCNLEAILKALKALEYLRRNNKDANILARHVIHDAIALCPDYSEFYTLLGYSHLMELYFQSNNPLISIAQASKAIKKALSLDENSSDAHIALARLYLIRRQHDEAIAAAETAVTLNPNGADAYSELGYILYNSERYAESVEFINKAIRLNPLPPSYYFLWLGHSTRALKRYEEAVEVYKKSAELEPNNIFSHL